MKGDIVQLVNASNATTIAIMTGTMDGSATDLCGIFMGCRFTDPNTNQLTFSQHFPASTAADDIMAYVVDDPNVLFTIQADGAFSNARDIYGKNAPVVQGTANTTLVISRVSLDD